MPVQDKAFRADPGAPSSNRLGDNDEAPRLPHQSTVRFHRIRSADGTLTSNGRPRRKEILQRYAALLSALSCS